MTSIYPAHIDISFLYNAMGFLAVPQLLRQISDKDLELVKRQQAIIKLENQCQHFEFLLSSLKQGLVKRIKDVIASDGSDECFTFHGSKILLTCSNSAIGRGFLFESHTLDELVVLIKNKDPKIRSIAYSTILQLVTKPAVFQMMNPATVAEDGRRTVLKQAPQIVAALMGKLTDETAPCFSQILEILARLLRMPLRIPGDTAQPVTFERDSSIVPVGIDSFLPILTKETQDMMIIYHACECVSSLLSYPASDIPAAILIPVCLELAEKGKKNVEVRAGLLRILLTVSSNTEAKIELFSSGFVDVVFDALQAIPPKSSWTKQLTLDSVQCLAMLAEYPLAREQIFLRKQIVEALEQSSDQDVVHVSKRALQVINWKP